MQHIGLQLVSPSGSKEAVDVWKGAAELFEVAVERRGETLKGNAKMLIQHFKHGHRQRPLQSCPLINATAKHDLDQETTREPTH